MAQKSMLFGLPPVSQVLKYPIEDDLNIEDGLRKPEDASLFLISSIAFLQKQVKKKLETSKTADTCVSIMGRKYSDLLIVESGQKFMRQRCFIKLANVEMFDEVLKKEASMPLNMLSNTQLLPLPKKWKSPKLLISSIFKPKSNIFIQNHDVSKKSSFFNLFKRSSSKDIGQTGRIINKIEVDTDNITVTIERESKPIEQITPTISSSSAKIPNISTSENQLQLEPNSSSSILRHQRSLTTAEEDILRVIPKDSESFIKQSINDKLRSSKQSLTDEDIAFSSEVSLVKKEDDYYEDLETGIKFKCLPGVTLKPRRVKEQQSKLSVCIEEEAESEVDFGPETTRRKYPFNCTDDVKSLVSSARIDLIMDEAWQLEGDTQ